MPLKRPRKPKAKPYDSKKIGKYPVPFIEQLRKQVAMTCNKLNPTRIFDFEATKQTAAFSELDKLLYAKGYPEIREGTLHNFFNKEPKQNGEEFPSFFTFHERNIHILEDFVRNNLGGNEAEIEKNEHEISTTLKLGEKESLSTKDSAVKNLLNALYSRQKATCTGESELSVSENGDVKMYVKIFLTAETDIYNLRINIFADHYIKIKQVIAREFLTNKELPIYQLEVSETSFFGFILLPEPLTVGANFVYFYEAIIDNYFQDLFEKKECYEQRFLVRNKFTSIKDTFKFPNIAMFNNVSISITKHPETNLQGMQLTPVIDATNKSFQLFNENLYEAQSMIEYKITI